MLFVAFGAAGQSDMELAEFYYNEGSYPQARLYLEPIWKKNKTNAVYEMYFCHAVGVGRL